MSVLYDVDPEGFDRSIGAPADEYTEERHTFGVDANLTIAQAYQAMRYFLDQYNEREPPEQRESIAQLLRWTEIAGDGISSDPAQWQDWQAAVVRAVKESHGGSD